MAQCPFCDTSLGDDFGLIQCPGCQRVSFVEIDGQVLTPVSSASSAEPASAPPDESPVPVTDADFEDIFTPNEPVAEASAEEAPAAEPEASMELGGLVDAEVPRDGNLRYELVITGVDTADLRQEMRDSLLDAKFLWDVEVIMKSIVNGEITLKNLSAVKAALLVNRLRSLPVQMRWEQYAIYED